jgi:CheY-like chemotaxis protein
MCKLVMIDDNPMEHLIMQSIFDHNELFHDASHCLEGRTIIEFLTNHKSNTEELPDLIFLDLNMPEFSGWDFLIEFERLYLSFPKPISVYIVTSSVNPDDKIRALQYSFVRDFLIKPVSKDKLELIYATSLKITRKTG